MRVAVIASKPASISLAKTSHLSNMLPVLKIGALNIAAKEVELLSGCSLHLPKKIVSKLFMIMIIALESHRMITMTIAWIACKSAAWSFQDFKFITERKISFAMALELDHFFHTGDES